jgi:hypothetical protein
MRAHGHDSTLSAKFPDRLERGATADHGERRKFSTGESRVTLTVDAEPAKAGIHPLDERMDRIPDDHVVRVGRVERK